MIPNFIQFVTRHLACIFLSCGLTVAQEPSRTIAGDTGQIQKTVESPLERQIREKIASDRMAAIRQKIDAKKSTSGQAAVSPNVNPWGNKGSSQLTNITGLSHSSYPLQIVRLKTDSQPYQIIVRNSAPRTLKIKVYKRQELDSNFQPRHLGTGAIVHFPPGVPGTYDIFNLLEKPFSEYFFQVLE